MSISKGQWAYMAVPRTESGLFGRPFFVGQVVLGDAPSQLSVMTRSEQLHGIADEQGMTRIVLVPALKVEEYDYPSYLDEDTTEWELETQTKKVWVRK